MFRLLLLVLISVMTLAMACDALAQTDDTGFGAGNPQPVEGAAQTTGENVSRQTGACDGMDTINEVKAEQEANPMRAMRTYDTESMRGCLEGHVVGFYTLFWGRYSDMDRDDPGRLSIQALVEEGRGFSISPESVQLSAKPPENTDWPGWEEMPEGLTDDEQRKWSDKQQAKYEIVWAEYERARDAELEEWDAFALSVSKGDTVRAECDLFNTRLNTPHPRTGWNLSAFESHTALHNNCHWLDD